MIERPLGSTRKIYRYTPDDIFPFLNNGDAPNQKEFDWVHSYASKWDWLVQIETDYLNIMADAAKQLVKVNSEFCKSLGYSDSCECEKQIDRAVTLFKTKIYDSEFKSDRDVKKKFSDLLKMTNEQEKALDNFTRQLYGWIHARYILTVPGLIKMASKFHNGTFGCCPRINCKKYPVLPMGLSDTLGVDRVKVFCPLCHDVYEVAEPKQQENGTDGMYTKMPWEAIRELDGAYFGTSFTGVFMTTFPEFCMEEANRIPNSSYTECMPLDIYKASITKVDKEESTDPVVKEELKKEILKYWGLSIRHLYTEVLEGKNVSANTSCKLVVYLPHYSDATVNKEIREFQENVKKVVVKVAEKETCEVQVQKVQFKRRSVTLREPD